MFFKGTEIIKDQGQHHYFRKARTLQLALIVKEELQTFE